MITRIIFENGKVYYKVADLAKLYCVKVYKMRQAIKEQNIGTNLNGFGRLVFVAEENVAKINVHGLVRTLETKFTKDPVKEIKIVELPKKESRKKKTEKVEEKVEEISVEKTEEKAVVANTVAVEPPTEIEALQEEHAHLLKKGKQLGVKLNDAEKMNLVHEICDKHLGAGNNFIDATVDDIEPMKLIVAELQIAVDELNTSPEQSVASA